MTSGHLGEWITARIFDIEPEASGAAAALTARFRSSALHGRAGEHSLTASNPVGGIVSVPVSLSRRKPGSFIVLGGWRPLLSSSIVANALFVRLEKPKPGSVPAAHTSQWSVSGASCLDGACQHPPSGPPRLVTWIRRPSSISLV
jgi:hypothetical protein